MLLVKGAIELMSAEATRRCKGFIAAMTATSVAHAGLDGTEAEYADCKSGIEHSSGSSGDDSLIVDCDRRLKMVIIVGRILKFEQWIAKQ